jgi:hypothetical protein
MDMTVGGSKNWSGRFEEEQNLLPLLQFQPLDLPAHSFAPSMSQVLLFMFC